MTNTRLLVSFSIILLTTGIFIVLPQPKENPSVPHGGLDRPYYFRVVLKQWQITIYDLNKIEDLVLSGIGYEQAMAESKYTDFVGNLVPGSHIFLQIYSMDVQHGISIDKLGIVKTITKITNDIDSTLPEYIDSTLPLTDSTFFIKCHVYCGMGHSSMSTKVVVGKGEVNYGPLVLKFSIMIIGLIALIFTNLILNDIPKSVLVIKDSKWKSKNKDQYLIYDVSRISTKDKLHLKMNLANIESAATLIDSIRTSSLSRVKEKVKKLSDFEKWNVEYYNL